MVRIKINYHKLETMGTIIITYFPLSLDLKKKKNQQRNSLKENYVIGDRMRGKALH